MDMRAKHEKEMDACKENEDDEDLEALRLAALESLRAKGLPPPLMTLKSVHPQKCSPQVNYCAGLSFVGCVCCFGRSFYEFD